MQNLLNRLNATESALILLGAFNFNDNKDLLSMVLKFLNSLLEGGNRSVQFTIGKEFFEKLPSKSEEILWKLHR
jgi:hypothetical protein